MLGEVIKKIRILNNLEQQEVAKMINTSRSYLCTLESSSKISKEKLAKLSEVYDLSIEQILKLNEEFLQFLANEDEKLAHLHLGFRILETYVLESDANKKTEEQRKKVPVKVKVKKSNKHL